MKTGDSMRVGWFGGVALGLLLLAPGWGRPARAQAEFPAVDAAGERLAAAVDGLEVERRWHAGSGVAWRTGEVKAGEPGLPTHSGEFVAAACDRLGVELLHPPEHAPGKLAAAQAAWLAGEGAGRGWRPIGSGVEAQALANRGFVVLALLRPREPSHSGLAAIVRPGARDRPSVEADGPDVSLAGHRNHHAIPLRAAFEADPAGRGEGEVVLFAHDGPGVGATRPGGALAGPAGASPSLPAVAGGLAKVARAVAPGAPPGHLAEVLAGALPRWASRGGQIERAHLLALAADPRVEGEQAAALAALLHATYQKGGPPWATFRPDQLREMAAGRHLDGRFRHLVDRLPEIRRTLFVDGTPHFDRIGQGATGDCYLFAGAGWMAKHRPRQIVEMIRPLADGRYEVHFRSGDHAVIEPPTDTELLYAESSGSLADGLWVAVIEKAVGVIAAQHDRKPAAIADPTIRMGQGGSGRLDVHRWTGHPVDEFHFREPGQAARARHALIEMDRRHLMAQAGVAVTHPPGPLPMNHQYAVLGFDPATDVVTVWNPWGDDYTPKGPPGVEHGWPRKHGVFEVPFRDFARVFHSLSVERP